jgi:hypothetical protein
VPAGRAYFTSIGKLVAGLEQADSLDPVTIKFARLFASVRDAKSRRVRRYDSVDGDFENRRNRFMNRLLGGKVRFENEEEYVETRDGRKVPFSSLSSGQQEILPMWTMIDHYSDLGHVDKLRTHILAATM